MKQKKSITILIAMIALAVALVFATPGVLSALTSSSSLPSSGTLTQVQSVNVGTYSNSACAINATSVDWGALRPGDNATRTLWVKNLGNTNATLSLSTTGWVPANAAPSISLSWDRQGKILAPNEVVQATLTLSVSAGIDSSITSFNFNIVITGTS